MSAGFIRLLGEIVDSPASPDWRSSKAQELCRRAHRYVQEAIALESQYASERQRAMELGAESRPDLAAMATARATRIHRERCNAIKNVAKLASDLVKIAAGSLVIDESTADTGLMADERRLVYAVQVGGA